PCVPRERVRRSAIRPQHILQTRAPEVLVHQSPHSPELASIDRCKEVVRRRDRAVRSEVRLHLFGRLRRFAAGVSRRIERTESSHTLTLEPGEPAAIRGLESWRRRAGRGSTATCTASGGGRCTHRNGRNPHQRVSKLRSGAWTLTCKVACASV